MAKNRVSSTLAAGLVAGISGSLVGLIVSNTASGSGYELFPLYAALAAFLSAALFWWLLLGRKNNYTIVRGVFAGGLASIVSHYLCWYLLILAQNLCYWVWKSCTSSLGEPPADPILGLLGAAGLSFFSLIFYWWLTVIPGILIAVVLSIWYRRGEKNSEVKISEVSS